MSGSVEALVRRLNAAWLAGDYEALGKLFHADAVLLMPGAEQSLQGRAAIVEGYRRFGALGEVHEFEITSLDVYPFGTTALCHMGFRIDYEIEATRYEESGTEVYALRKSGAGWRIVWRTQITR